MEFQTYNVYQPIYDVNSKDNILKIALLAAFMLIKKEADEFEDDVNFNDMIEAKGVSQVCEELVNEITANSTIDKGSLSVMFATNVELEHRQTNGYGESKFKILTDIIETHNLNLILYKSFVLDKVNNIISEFDFEPYVVEEVVYPSERDLLSYVTTQPTRQPVISPEIRKERAIIELKKQLDQYINSRREKPTTTGSRFFQRWQYTLEDKENAVNALIENLDGAKNDLKSHLNVLKNGDLGTLLNKFINQGYATDIAGIEVTTIKQLVGFLQPSQVVTHSNQTQSSDMYPTLNDML